jgi:hypothetical protein
MTLGRFDTWQELARSQQGPGVLVKTEAGYSEEILNIQIIKKV